MQNTIVLVQQIANAVAKSYQKMKAKKRKEDKSEKRKESSVIFYAHQDIVQATGS